MEKNYFSFFYQGQEYILPKKGINFKYGYAIIKLYAYFTICNEPYGFEMYGIIDENYQLCHELIPVFMMPKIDILSDKKFIAQFKENMNEEPDYSVYFCTLTSAGLEGKYDLLATDYELVGDKIILKSMMDGNIPAMALYDFRDENILTPYYNSIGNFEYRCEYNCIAAEAITYVFNEHLNRQGYIYCWIDLNGNVVSTYQNTLNDVWYASNYSLSEVIQFVQNISIVDNKRIR